MTTIIAVKTNKGEPVVVIGADTQLTTYDDKKDEIPLGKTFGHKISYDDSWVIAWSGVHNQYLEKFIKHMKGQKGAGSSPEISQQALNTALEKFYKQGDRCPGPHFLEFTNANAVFLRQPNTKTNDLCELLLAVQKSEFCQSPDFFRVDELGNLSQPQTENDFPYYSLGSDGSDKVDRYIEDLIEEEVINPSEITTQSALKLIIEAFHKAKKDITTGGPTDLIVVKESEIVSYIDRVRKALSEAEKEEDERIIKENAPREVPGA